MSSYLTPATPVNLCVYSPPVSIEQTPGATLPTPGATHQTPGASHPTPGVIHSTPGVTHSTPVATLPTPGVTHPTPGVTHPTPGTTHQTPGATHQTPGTAFPTPAVVHPVPGTIHPTSGATHPTAGAAHPTPGVTHPASGASHPIPGTNHPTPGATHPTPGVTHPTPGTTHPTSGATHPTPGINHLTPGTTHPIPGTIHPASGATHPTPGANHPTPGDSHPPSASIDELQTSMSAASEHMCNHQILSRTDATASTGHESNCVELLSGKNHPITANTCPLPASMNHVTSGPEPVPSGRKLTPIITNPSSTSPYQAPATVNQIPIIIDTRMRTYTATASTDATYANTCLVHASIEHSPDSAHKHDSSQVHASIKSSSSSRVSPAQGDICLPTPVINLHETGDNQQQTSHDSATVDTNQRISRDICIENTPSSTYQSTPLCISTPPRTYEPTLAGTSALAVSSCVPPCTFQTPSLSASAPTSTYQSALTSTSATSSTSTISSTSAMSSIFAPATTVQEDAALNDNFCQMQIDTATDTNISAHNDGSVHATNMDISELNSDTQKQDNNAPEITQLPPEFTNSRPNSLDISQGYASRRRVNFLVYV